MQRRYFDQIHVEISLALDRRVSRYALWLAIWEHGGDPDALSRDEARHFVETGLIPYLEAEGALLSRRTQRRLARRLLRFDPRFPTPEEWLTSWSHDVRPGPPASPRQRSSR